MASLTTNLPNGITNADSNSAMGTLTQLDPSKVHAYFNDFNLYNAADWVVTVVGIATQAITDESGGFLGLTNGQATNDSTFLQLVNENFKFVSGKKLHFKARFRTISSSFDAGAFVIGLQIRDTAPLSVSDGVYFLKSASSSDLTFNVTKDSVSSSATVATLTASQTIIVDFVYDGRSEVQYWINDVKIGALDVTNLPDDEELTISFGHVTQFIDPNLMSFDYIYIANER